METRYFYTQRIDLLQDISARIGDKAYSFLKEQNPQSISQIQLVQTGIWLQLDEPISSFLSNQFVLGVENRLKNLGEFDWMRFAEEVTGLPDTIQIESHVKNEIFGHIADYITKYDWGEDGLPDDPRDQLRKVLFNLQLQNKLCSLSNGLVLNQAKNWLATRDHNRENPITLAYVNFHSSVANLLEAWFFKNELDIPSIESTKKQRRPKKSKSRTIDKYPDLQQHKKDTFPALRQELYREYRLLVDRLFPVDKKFSDDQKEYLVRSFLNSARRKMSDRLKRRKKVTDPRHSKEGDIIILISRKKTL